MKLSVVIPALDEAEHIEAAVLSALPEAADTVRAEVLESGERPRPGAGPGLPGEIDLEILVVDGGSRDATRERAERAGARVVESPPGRARQLACGVRQSAGDVLLFLHADTRLPPGWVSSVTAALFDPQVVGGAFRFGFDATTPALRFIEFGARLRNRWFSMPYGDQALFLRRRVLEEIGGVPQAPILEDLDLVVAMKHRGRLALLPQIATTSARRYQQRGPLRTMGFHWAIVGAWLLGVSRRRIASWARR